MNGFIKLHRKLLEWEWIDDPKTAHLFVVLLLLANHKPKKWHNTQVDRGQFITGLNSLSKKSGLSVQEVRTALKKLESTGEATSQATNRFRIITINNYCQYQGIDKAEQQAEQQASNKQATSKQQQLKNVKNVKKEKILVQVEYDDSFLTFWKMYPRKTGKADAYSSWKAGNLSNGHFDEVLSGLTTCMIEEDWGDREMKYIPLATTWLNQKRWEDWHDAETTTAEPPSRRTQQ